MGSKDLIIKCKDCDKSIDELISGDFALYNTFSSKTIIEMPTIESNRIVRGIEKTGIISDWLFGIEFIDKSNVYYTLTNGMIVSSK